MSTSGQAPFHGAARPATQASSPAGRPAEERPFHALREDLQIHEGMRDLDGHRTWTLLDPLRNRYFQLTERDFNLVSCWALGNVADVCRWMTENSLPVRAEDVEEFQEFLMRSELLVATEGLRRRLFQLSTMREMSPWKRALHTYLSLRLPLLHPDALLDSLYPRLRFLFSPVFLRLTALVGLVGFCLILRQWESFAATLSWFFNPENLLVFFATLVGVKVLHEFGHALMCKHFGLRVPTMGVAFLVMWPVLYTDASDAWRLTSRRQRALISAGGVITESLLVCYAMLAWVFLPDGVLRSVLFSVITTVWVSSLLVNFNPVMKFDGYYFASDLLNIPNLQDRSFAFGRWKLREWLFGSKLSAPEAVRPDIQRFLIGFAFFVWVYRFFMFLGIALLVYHFFFKALGIFLFAVELWWFILRPILAETSQWRGMWSGMTLGRRRWYLGAAALGAIVLVFPWRPDLRLPAEASDAEILRVFPVRDGYIESVLVKDGQSVAAGQLLAVMKSPELENQLGQARREVAAIENALDRFSSDGFSDDMRVRSQDLVRARSQLQALTQEHERMQMRAAFAGVVRDIDVALFPAGRWMSRDSRLLTLVGGRRPKVVAWVGEGDLAAVPDATEGRFYPERPIAPVAREFRLVSIEKAAMTSLASPYQASVYGGQLAVRPDQEGRLLPEVALFKLEFEAIGDDEAGKEVAPVVARGWISVEGRRRTLLGRMARAVAGTLLRESGF